MIETARAAGPKVRPADRLRTWLERPGPLALLIGALALAVYLQAPVRFVADSSYSMLVSQSILDHGSVDLSRYFRFPLDPRRYPGIRRHELYPYVIDVVDGVPYYVYALGSSVLALPIVKLANLVGVSAVGPDDTYNAAGEQAIEGVAASLVSAVAVGFIVLTARRYLPASWSAGVGLVCAFGTPLFSTTSRVLWSHGGVVMLLSIWIWLAARDLRARPIRTAAISALLLPLLVAFRSTGVISVGAGALLFLLVHPRALPLYLPLAGACSALLVLLNGLATGRLVGIYYAHTVTYSITQQSDYLANLAGVLLSPSRGLLVFLPTLVFVGVLLVRYRRWLPEWPLLVTAAVASGAQIAGLARWPWWVGGSSYGPRLLTDALPYFALLAILALAGLRRAWAERPPAESGAGRRTLIAVGGLTVAASLFVHARGAYDWRTQAWNERLGASPTWAGFAWDWREPQFLVGLVPSTDPARPAVVERPSGAGGRGAPAETDLSRTPLNPAPTSVGLERVGPHLQPRRGAVLALEGLEPGGLQVSGWAVDRPAGDVAWGVGVEIDRGAVYWTRYGQSRPDVAAALNNPRLRDSAFQVTLPPSALSPGRHELRLLVLAADSSSYYAVDPGVSLEVR